MSIPSHDAEERLESEAGSVEVRDVLKPVEAPAPGMNAAALFVKCLEAEGVKYIFGVPGEENARLLMALEDSPIQFILTRHEQGAAFMAEIYGKLTGKAGVCLGTLGPGATNLVTGVAESNMDRAPLVCITSQADSRRQHKESHQAMDVVGMFKPVTKWATPVINPDNIPEVIRKAFRQAQREKPGACHIELADDIAAMPAGAKPVPAPYVRRPVPDDKIINQAWAEIKRAERPVIVAGNGAIRTRASRQLRQFVEAIGIGVVSTFMGKGCISRHDPRYLFTIGVEARNMAGCAVCRADLVITLGYDLVEYPPRLWNENGDRKIIHIDFLPAESDYSYQPAVEVVGDLAHTLWALNQRLWAEPIHFNVEDYQTIRREMLESFAEHKDDDTEELIRPQKVMWDVREAMGPTDILLCDVGAHKMWVARNYHCDEPNTCLIPNGFCSMGSALPGAIAAKMVHADRRVLAIAGDGGFLMNVQDLETAKRLGANIVCMIWQDNDYGLISWKQRAQFGRNTDCSFGNPDFVKLAESFDCKGIRVERSRDLAPALEEAFSADRPCLIVVPIDYRENERLGERFRGGHCPLGDAPCEKKPIRIT